MPLHISWARSLSMPYESCISTYVGCEPQGRCHNFGLTPTLLYTKGDSRNASKYRASVILSCTYQMLSELMLLRVKHPMCNVLSRQEAAGSKRHPAMAMALWSNISALCGRSSHCGAPNPQNISELPPPFHVADHVQGRCLAHHDLHVAQCTRTHAMLVHGGLPVLDVPPNMRRQGALSSLPPLVLFCAPEVSLHSFPPLPSH